MSFITCYNFGPSSARWQYFSSSSTSSQLRVKATLLHIMQINHGVDMCNCAYINLDLGLGLVQAN